MVGEDLTCLKITITFEPQNNPSFAFQALWMSWIINLHPVYYCLFSCFRSKLNEAKLLQTLRKRPNGVSVVSLAIGQKVPEIEASVVSLMLYSSENHHLLSKD